MKHTIGINYLNIKDLNFDKIKKLSNSGSKNDP